MKTLIPAFIAILRLALLIWARTAGPTGGGCSGRHNTPTSASGATNVRPQSGYGPWKVITVTASAIQLTVNNAGAPMPDPTPAVDGPVGKVPPPAGQNWVVTFSDNFARDATVNSAIWNGGIGGGNPFCHPSGLAVRLFATPMIDCLGYAGSQGKECVGNFRGDSIHGGLVVQDHNSAPGDNNYFDNEWAGVQNYGKFSQEYGYFQWVAKLPTNANGEGDGLHTDLWCTPNGRNTLGPNAGAQGAEADVNERVAGPSNRNFTWFTVWDGVAGSATSYAYGAAGSPDLSSAYHTYGLYWRNDGSAPYGSMQLYVDGAPKGGPPKSAIPFGAAAFIASAVGCNSKPAELGAAG